MLMTSNNSCGYWHDGYCTYHQVDCDKVSLRECTSIKELNEIVK
jgi:hypothetical protein